MARQLELPNPRGTKRPLTQLDRALLSLARASSWSTKKLNYEDIVIQAWRDWPEQFGLRNHPEFPDASDVHKALYDLKPAGFVVSLGNKVFRLSEAGIERARAIESALANSKDTPAPAARLGRDEQNFLEHARGSRAFSTWRSGEAAKLIDYDARIFFQFSTGTPPDQRKLRVRFAIDTLVKAKELALEGAAELLLLAEELSDRFLRLASR